MSALRAFEATVRCQGIAGAAAETLVTPSAVSHQIRQLETELGVKLMRRDGRKLVLTNAGERLYQPLAGAIEKIVGAVADMQEAESSAPLTIAMLQNIAVNWFLPRLERFRRRHPDIDVRLVLTPRHVDFTREDVDLSIRYGMAPWPDLYSAPLLQDRLTPMCSPDYMQAHGPFAPMERLYSQRLIVSNTRSTDEWTLWLRAAGLDPTLFSRTRIELDSTHLALQAAANGIGFAIAGRALAHTMLERKALIAPFSKSIRERAGYHIVCPKNWVGRRKIQSLIRWLHEESRQSAARASKAPAE